MTHQAEPGQVGARAIFVSYASEDAAAADRIGAALSAAGIEVWLDKSVLRSGDAWDQKIRREIRDCTLFVALISRNTEARTEGYFRLEWHLADQRTQLMARSRPFLVPVCVDDTPERHAEVPESFSLVHWSRLPGGESSPEFIERMRKLLALEPLPGVAAAEAQASSSRASRPGAGGGWRSLRWAAVLGALVLLAGGMLAAAAWRGYFWRDPLANAQFTRLTDWPGRELAAAISRDGGSVAFLADRDGPNDVWVTEVGSMRYRNLTHGALGNLTNNPEVRSLGFSADGSLITVWQRKPGGTRSADINILALPAAGGEARHYLQGVGEVAWSSDGTRIAYHETGPGDPIFVAPAAGGTAHRIYAAAAGVHCHFQVWSSDDAFIYFTQGVPGDHWDLWRIRPDGAQPERLTFHNSLVTHPVVLGEYTLLYLATDAQGGGPWLYGIDVRHRVPHRLSFGLERYTSLGASGDGTRLAVTVARPSSGLWHLPLASGASAVTAAAPLSPDFAAGVSPRGGAGYVLYISRSAGRPGIWKFADGASHELWAGAPSDSLSAPAVARDGRIAFTVADGARTRLYVIQGDGRHANLLADSFELRGNPAWSPDGRSIAVAVLHDGEPRIMSFPAEGGAPLPLVHEYSIDPAWSPDGQFLLYAGADVGVSFPLRAVEPDGRPYPLPPLMLSRGAHRVVFASEPNSIVVLRGDFEHKDFWLIDLKSGAERRLTQLNADFDIRDFDLSADKGAILFDRVEESSTVALIERSG